MAFTKIVRLPAIRHSHIIIKSLLKTRNGRKIFHLDVEREREREREMIQE